MVPDSVLLRRYAEHHNDAAFAELVRRHIDLVYSVALRQANGDTHLAEDATQAVFTDLARKARLLSGRETLAGWLHTSARFAASNAVRGEARRRAREHEAVTMHELTATPETAWGQLRPLLDESVGQLKETDRDAIVLRFFEGKSHEEIGTILGLSENSANKRVERALDKLREHFAQRGVRASSALLATAMAENSVQAAPVGLAASITSASLASVGNMATGGTILTALFMTTKTKIVLAAVIILAIVATLAVKRQSSDEAPVSSSTAVAPTAKMLPPLFAGLRTVTPAQVAAPVVAPAPAEGSSGPAVIASGTLTMSSPPPNADLKTAIPALIHYLETDDYVDMVPFCMTPAEVQQAVDSGYSMQDMAYRIQMDIKNFGGPDFGVQALTEIQGLPASIDVTGTKATYELDNPVLGHKTFIFIKKDGLWYGPQ